MHPEYENLVSIPTITTWLVKSYDNDRNLVEREFFTKASLRGYLMALDDAGRNYDLTEIKTTA